MIILPHQAAELFIVPQIRRTLSAVDAQQADTPRTRSARLSRGLSHTQFFISSRVGVRCLSGRLATRTDIGLQALSLLYITNGIRYKLIAHLLAARSLPPSINASSSCQACSAQSRTAKSHHHPASLPHSHFYGLPTYLLVQNTPSLADGAVAGSLMIPAPVAKFSTFCHPS